MDIDQVITIIVIAGVVGALAILFLSIVDPDIRRWFRVMARRDLPSWDVLLRHLDTHDFGWNGACETCRQQGRQAGQRDAELSYADRTRAAERPAREDNRPEMWGKGYEAGYSDGQANRPRRGR